MMADAISAEEQRQIDAAIALSLDHEPQSATVLPPTATAESHKQHTRQVINIDDDSSENESLPKTTAAEQEKTGTSAPITRSEDDYQGANASTDSSATDLSNDESAIETISNGKKRQLVSQPEEDAKHRKKAKRSLLSPPIASSKYRPSMWSCHSKLTLTVLASSC